MTRTILLDAGVVGLLVSPPNLPAVRRALSWLDSLLGKVDIMIPDITDFETRRELIRLGATTKLTRLDDLHTSLLRIEVTQAAWLKAAEFWASVRRAGVPTASPDALDADAILAGVAVTLGLPGDEVLIATTNVRHLSRFPGVVALPWEQTK